MQAVSLSAEHLCGHVILGRWRICCALRHLRRVHFARLCELSKNALRRLRAKRWLRGVHRGAAASRSRAAGACACAARADAARGIAGAGCALL